MVDTPVGRLGVPQQYQDMADIGGQIPPDSPTGEVHIRLGGAGGPVVRFSQMPTAAQMQQVADHLGLGPPAFPPPTGAPPVSNDPSQPGREFIPGMPVTPIATGRKYAPEIGAAIGGFSPIPGGTALGSLAGSAIQRGGMPTMGDVGSALATEVGGQVLQRVPGLVRAGLTRGTQAIQAGAERFGIPLGVGELSRSPVVQSALNRLAANPFASRAIGRAGRFQSEAIGAEATRIGKEWFRGARAKKALLQTAKEISSGKSAAATAAAKTIAQRTLALARFAGTVAEDPHRATVIAAQMGEGAMQTLRQAWWTTALDEATVKHGVRKGLVSPKTIVSAWDKLTDQGQRVLFGNRAPHLRAFVDTLREAKVADLAGKGTHLPQYFRWTVGGLILGRGGEWSHKAAELLGIEIAAPWVAAHLLTEGPETAIGSILAPATAAAARGGISAIAQANQQAQVDTQP